MSEETQALLALVQGIDGKDWASRRRGWSAQAEEPVCMWDGIICDPSDNSITSIRIQSADLYATIPEEWGQLKSLRTLVLRENLLYGSIPPEVAALPNLQTFDVAENDLSGPLPLFKSMSLGVMDASRNKLSGSLPSSIGEDHGLTLALFDVMDNNLTGSIPSSISKMKNLGTLSLGSNNFWGLIPPSLGSLPMLQYLYLDNNNLVGPIPPSLARFQSGGIESSLLSEVWFQENMLSGTIPAAMADLKKLVNFYVDGNKLTGKVPRDLCSETLNADFFSNIPADAQRDLCDSVACPVNEVAFEGVYPCSPCDSLHYNPYLGRTGECIALNQRLIMEKFYESTSKLGPWDGGSNWNHDETFLCDFDGVTCDGNNNVIEIKLNGRGLSGTIPEELGFLEYLEILDLSDNNDLTGFLPSDLRWAPLRHLDVSGTKLRGIVPPMLCLKQGVNGNGINGDYNCERISCPAGTFSPTGKRGNAPGEHCVPCADDGATYLGMKQCKRVGVRDESSGSHGGLGVSGLTGTVVAIAAIAVAAALSIALQSYRRKYASRRVLRQGDGDDEIVFEKTVYNQTGVSSLPYADEPRRSQTGPTSSRTGTWKDLAANRVPSSSYRDEPPNQKTAEPFSIGQIGDSDDDMDDDEERYEDEESMSSALEKEVRRQQSHGPSTKAPVWKYPDPLEEEDARSISSSAWDAEKDSKKEVWLDVPKI